jgi:hypothetical protein
MSDNEGHQKWEYFATNVEGSPREATKELDDYGDDGWELVAIDEGRYVFKRAKD